MRPAIDVCFFFIDKKIVKLWVPTSNANTFTLLDDKIELHSKICLITVLN